jgi:hypothetical protein
MRLANGNAYGYIHSDGDSDGDCHIHSDGDSDSDCHIHSDGNCDGHVYANRDSNGNCNRTASAYTIATASAHAAAACEQLL